MKRFLGLTCTAVLAACGGGGSDGGSMAPPPDLIELSVANASVTEADVGWNELEFTVQLSRPADRFVTADYAIANGSATNGVDFVAVNGTVQFDVGQSRNTIPVIVIGDIVKEPDETLTISISNVVNAELSVGEATGTIIDNEEAPTISVIVAGTIESDDLPNPVAGAQKVTVGTSGDDVLLSSKTVAEPWLYVEGKLREGDIGVSQGIIYVHLSGPASDLVSADFRTVSQTAIAGNDFVSSSGRVELEPGETMAIIPIDVIGDDVMEGDESFKLILENIVGVQAAAEETVVTIREGDIVPSAIPDVFIDDVTVAEGDFGATGLMEFQVRMSSPSDRTVWMTFDVISETATLGDYVVVDKKPLSIQSGTTVATYSVGIINDIVDEGDETFRVEITDLAYAQIGDGVAVGTIEDDDLPLPPPAMLPDIHFLSGSMEENSGIEEDFFMTAVLSEPSFQEVTFSYLLSDITSTAGDDYVGRAPAYGTITIPPGELSATSNFLLLGDFFIEGTETVKVVIANAVNANIVDGGLVEIIDDDPVPSVSIRDAVAGESGTEGENSVLTFEARIPYKSARSRNIDYRTKDDIALAGVDYVEKQGTFTIAPGELTASVEIEILPDELVEGHETLILEIHGVFNSDFADRYEIIGTIIDDD
jgi:chitinase